MQGVEICIQRAVDRSHITNGNYFTFKHLQKAIENITQTVAGIEAILSKNNMWVDAYRISSIIRRCEDLEKQLMNWGKDEKDFELSASNSSEQYEQTYISKTAQLK